MKMNERKSHSRIHQVIIQRRSKAKIEESSDLDTACLKKLQKSRVSATSSLANSYILSQSQTTSLVLPKGDSIDCQTKNVYQISNLISSQSLDPSKPEHPHFKRQIKSARPVSRRKITSKDKYSQKSCQKEDLPKIQTEKTSVFETLQILQPQFFILQKQNGKYQYQEAEITNLKAFWAKSHIFVSLFPLQYTQCVIYKHPNILPVYGEVKIKEKRYVVSNQYKHCSLKDLIKQFGAFEERLCRIYLNQILSGLQQMHNRKMAHNRLNTESILYDKEGQIFINVVKSTSRPLTQKQRQQNIFKYSPQILLAKSKSNSRRSDIWSIGTLLLDMLFNFQISDANYMNFHPYNSSFELQNSNDAIIVDNLKQLYPQAFMKQTRIELEQKINNKYQYLSQQCRDLIFKCLKIDRDQRITLKKLKDHPFFTKYQFTQVSLNQKPF